MLCNVLCLSVIKAVIINNFCSDNIHMSEHVVVRCKAKTKSKTQCKRNTARSHFCWMHLKSNESLQIKKSTIPNSGLGLYTLKNRKRNDKITGYTGKRITAEEAKNSNSQYIFQPTKTVFIDSKRSSEAPGRFVNDGRSAAGPEARSPLH